MKLRSQQFLGTTYSILSTPNYLFLMRKSKLSNIYYFPKSVFSKGSSWQTFSYPRKKTRKSTQGPPLFMPKLHCKVDWILKNWTGKKKPLVALKTTTKSVCERHACKLYGSNGSLQYINPEALVDLRALLHGHNKSTYSLLYRDYPRVTH